MNTVNTDNEAVKEESKSENNAVSNPIIPVAPSITSEEPKFEEKSGEQVDMFDEVFGYLKSYITIYIIYSNYFNFYIYIEIIYLIFHILNSPLITPVILI